MEDNSRQNKREETMHRVIVPILHCSLWIFGLIWTKYGVDILEAVGILYIDSNDVFTNSLCNIFPAFLVFLFELAVTFYDIKVSCGRRYLKLKFSVYVSVLFALVGLISLFVFLYYLMPSVEWMFLLLIVSTSILKFMEYHLLNNIKSYLVDKSIELDDLMDNYIIGYQK